MQQRATATAEIPLRPMAPNPAFTAEQRRMDAMLSWVPFAVVVLTSAMLATVAISVYKIDRTLVLAVQYFLWVVATYLMLTAVPRLDRRSRMAPSRISRWLVAFLVAFAVATAGVWFGESRSDINAVLLQSAALLFMALPFFAMSRASATLRVDRALLWTCHVILALSVYSVLSDFIGLSHFESGGGRFFGALGDSVAWALTLPLIVYFASNRIPLAIVAGLTLALTASRAPALSTIAALLLLMVFSRGRRFQYGILIVMLIIVGLYQAGLFVTLVDRLGGTQLTSNDRTATALLGLKIFTRSPLFGSGYNSLAHFYPTNAHLYALNVLPAQTSTFVQMLSDSGIVTFLMYMGFVVTISIGGIALMRRSRQIAEGGLINGVVAWLLAMLWVNQSALWFVVGSYIGPLVFGMAGVVAGTLMRVRTAERMHPVTPIRLNS